MCHLFRPHNLVLYTRTTTSFSLGCKCQKFSIMYYCYYFVHIIYRRKKNSHTFHSTHILVHHLQSRTTLFSWWLSLTCNPSLISIHLLFIICILQFLRHYINPLICKENFILKIYKWLINLFQLRPIRVASKEFSGITQTTPFSTSINKFLPIPPSV